MLDKNKIICKIIILLLIISFLVPTTTSYSNVFPPDTDWELGYNETSRGSTYSISPTHINLTIEGGAGDGDEVYYVTDNAVDLRNISFIYIRWSGSFGAVPGASVIGISNNKMDNSFLTNATRTSSFTNTYDTVDVSSYSGDYYIKTGGYTKASAFFDDIDISITQIRFHNYTVSWPTEPQSIQKTSATLYGYLEQDSTNLVGFWYGNQTPTQALVDSGDCTNTSYGTKSPPSSFYKSVSGLTQYELYHVKTWGYDYYGGFNFSTNESYFIPRPDGPTNLQIASAGASSINLTFTPASVPGAFNSTTIIKYSSTTYPTTISEGSLGANTTNNYAVITSLGEETTYYFSAFTWINQSDIEQFSSQYATASGATEGGIYNIIVRDELEIAGANLPINLSRWYGPHRLIIHYTDETDYVKFENYGVVESTCYGGTFTYNETGNFTIEVNKTIQYLEFQWNYTTNRTFRCNRILIPSTSQRNITFYIRTDLPVYGEGSAYPNQSIIPYKYSFLDENGKFTTTNHAYCKIFEYNSTGTYHLIHAEYLDTSGVVYPWLVYGKKYFIGMYCDVMSIERIGTCPTGDTQAVDIRIPYEANYSYGFLDLINLDIGWYDDGFYVAYQDTTSSTVIITFEVFYYDNETNTGHSENSTFSTGNFTYTTAEGCNTSISYIWRLTAELEGIDVDGVSNKYSGTYIIESSMPSGNFTIINVATLDDLIEIIFGISPIYNYDRPGDTPVRWTYILLFGFSFILLVTFGKLNAFLGMMACGMGIGIGGALIGGIGWVMVIAILMIVLAVIGLIGGVERR